MMGEDETEKKIETKKVDSIQQGSEGVVPSFPDVCETPSPAEPIPIPYPNIAKSSDTSKGSKKVKISGKEVMTRASSYKKSSGDEAGNNSGMSMIIKAMKFKKLGIPVWIWSCIIVVGLLAIWLLSSSIMPPIEPYDVPLE